MSITPDEKQIVDHAMRALWWLVEMQGGTITITAVGSIEGAMHVSWNNGLITVSIAQGHETRKQ